MLGTMRGVMDSLGGSATCFISVCVLALGHKDALTNGEVEQHMSPPQKSLPDLPPPKIVSLFVPLL